MLSNPVCNQTSALRSTDFVNYLHDYRVNWTSLGPITRINLNVQIIGPGITQCWVIGVSRPSQPDNRDVVLLLRSQNFLNYRMAFNILWPSKFSCLEVFLSLFWL